MRLIPLQRRSRTGRGAGRRGNVVVLTAAMLTMIFGFAAFSVDVGFITLTRAQMQAANDASVLAAAMELGDGLGQGATRTVAETEAASRQAAIQIAALHRAGDRNSITVDPEDVRFGQVVWGGAGWVQTWGVPPYNLVEVRLRRDPGATDGPLPLFFAPVIGHRNANLEVRAAAAILPGYGFRIPPGSNQTVAALPFALDEETWNALVAGLITEDRFSYDPDTGAVTPGSDGVFEVNLFPDGSNKPPGNRGTVDFGSADNSTAKVRRQILFGLTADDLAFHGGELKATPEEPIDLGGNTGISAGMEEALKTIRGRPSAIPIFTHVQNPGNNAVYTIVRFVGVRVMDVKLDGNPKHVMIQPAPFLDSAVIPDQGDSGGGGGTLDPHSIFTTPRLMH